jgi:hypothetical protein
MFLNENILTDCCTAQSMVLKILLRLEVGPVIFGASRSGSSSPGEFGAGSSQFD